MMKEKLPEWYQSIRKRHKKCLDALERLGKAVREEGPLDEKTSHLIQLAAAASIRSEGSVHSHARRAIQAGATADEVYHTLMLLTSTVGFPIVSAALSWVQEVVDQG
jgi:4-carboxymuconolactone decarboxylase